MFIGAQVFAQEFNQLDAQGKRHGKWQKYFEGTKKLRYQGQFEHGKEIGTFKFYHLKAKGKHPSCIKEFSKDSNISQVKYYTSTGVLLSEGQMKGKKRFGKWISYHKNSSVIMDEELYENGTLNGIKTTYYKDGKVLSRETYLNGVLNGKNQLFAENGQLVKDLNYTNGKLNGPFKHYEKQGKVKLDGKYEMGKPRGVWKYYEGGKLVNSKDYTKSNNPIKKKKN